jgi:hypothetical protein
MRRPQSQQFWRPLVTNGTRIADVASPRAPEGHQSRPQGQVNGSDFESEPPAPYNQRRLAGHDRDGLVRECSGLKPELEAAGLELTRARAVLSSAMRRGRVPRGGPGPDNRQDPRGGRGDPGAIAAGLNDAGIPTPRGQGVLERDAGQADT